MSIRHSALGASVCQFTFVDGRRCRTPRCPGHTHLCTFHAKKEAEARARQEIGYDIGCWLTGEYVSACDLSAALGRVFSNAAQGKIKLRMASTLGYLGQTMANLIPIAQNEYVNARGAEAWRAAIRNSREADPANSPSLQRPQPQADQPPANPPAERQASAEPARDSSADNLVCVAQSLSPTANDK